MAQVGVCGEFAFMIDVSDLVRVGFAHSMFTSLPVLFPESCERGSTRSSVSEVDQRCLPQSLLTK